jgi:biopolymer transport protein ExbB
MADLFTRGGPLMYPILLCSIIGWAIFMERIIAFVRVRHSLFSLKKSVMSKLNQGCIQDAAQICTQSKMPLAKILSVVLKNCGRKRSYLKDLAEEVGEREAVALQRYLGLLGTIANITPLLGLLGTVLGMIKAFNVIATEGMGTPASLGGGISEALITTAAGLTVSVPMILLHRYLTSRSDRLVLELEEATMQVVDLVEE